MAAEKTNEPGTAADERMPAANIPAPRSRWSDRFAERDKPRAVGATLKRLARYFGRERKLVVAMIALAIAGAIAGVAAPGLQSVAVDVACGERAGDVGVAVGAMLACYLAYAAAQFFQSLASAHVSQRIVGRLRADLFGKAMDLPVDYLDHHPHGDLISRMTNDVDNVSTTVSESLPTLCAGVLMISGTFAAMLAFCWQLALISCSVVVLTAVATKFIASRVRLYARERQEHLGRLDALLEERVAGFKTVCAYGRGAETAQAFRRESKALTRAGIRAEAYGGVMGPVMNCIGNLGFVMVAVFGGLFASRGIITVGVLSAFVVYLRQFGRPLNELAQVYGQIQEALAGAERVFAVLDEASEDVTGAPFARAGAPAISFECVRFSYVPGTPVLTGFSLQVRAGAKVALVGATGSGKTTVANLLERFYDPQGGRIVVGGCDLARTARPSLRHAIACVLQESSLFTDTVRANLRYGKPDATDDELWCALAESGADGLVRALPQGLDTVLAGGGSALSAGERQLLSIARAFVADPAVCVLDEATSNVDTRTEQTVQRALERVMANRTCIVIAHRLSTVRDADLIVVMDHGRIVESGNHAELVRAQGVYWRLYRAQFAGERT